MWHCFLWRNIHYIFVTKVAFVYPEKTRPRTDITYSACYLRQIVWQTQNCTRRAQAFVFHIHQGSYTQPSNIKFQYKDLGHIIKKNNTFFNINNNIHNFLLKNKNIINNYSHTRSSQFCTSSSDPEVPSHSDSYISLLLYMLFELPGMFWRGERRVDDMWQSSPTEWRSIIFSNWNVST